MKGLSGLFKAFMGKEVGALSPGLIWSSLKSGTKNAISNSTAKSAWQAMKFNLIFGGAASLLAPGTADEKLANLSLTVGTAFMTMGMNSPWRQMFWGSMANMMPHFSGITRGIVQGYRGSLESRTSLSIPFSHSSMSMDVALSTMQYSQSRLAEANSTLNSQAAFFAARYLSR